MGLFSSKDRSKDQAAREELKAARKELHSLPADVDDDVFEEKNAAVIRAEKKVPWHRR